jgi:hypothetical protein
MAAAKNISYDGECDVLKVAQGDDADLVQLQAMLTRYRRQACRLITALFPYYAAKLRIGRTSLRTARVEGRKTSWRQDDSRLHVDAFPSSPNQGERILRVFTNVNPNGEARVWRVGERFDELAKRLMPRVRRPLPGSAVSGQYMCEQTLHLPISSSRQPDGAPLKVLERFLGRALVRK